jgi:serine/threonine-protein kinase RsbW
MPEHLAQARPPALRLLLPCDLAQVRSAAEMVHNFLAEMGCHPQELMDCELTLVEACNNAIKYAQASARHKPVIIEVLWHKQEIELRVSDSGPGFDWPEPAPVPEPESERGRGIFLIQSLTDYANYFRSASGNILVMRKKHVRE